MLVNEEKEKKSTEKSHVPLHRKSYKSLSFGQDFCALALLYLYNLYSIECWVVMHTQDINSKHSKRVETH